MPCFSKLKSTGLLTFSKALSSSTTRSLAAQADTRRTVSHTCCSESRCARNVDTVRHCISTCCMLTLSLCRILHCEANGGLFVLGQKVNDIKRAHLLVQGCSRRQTEQCHSEKWTTSKHNLHAEHTSLVRLPLIAMTRSPFLILFFSAEDPDVGGDATANCPSYSMKWEKNRSRHAEMVTEES